MNPFEQYASRARTIVERPTPLVGKHKTRAEAKAAYSEIVERLRTCANRGDLESYLVEIEPDLLQFHAELDFLWEGDGEDFPGLDREIESAFETVEAAQFFHQFQGRALGSQCVSV